MFWLPELLMEGQKPLRFNLKYPRLCFAVSWVWNEMSGSK